MSLLKSSKSNQSVGVLFAIFFIFCSLVLSYINDDLLNFRDRFLMSRIESAKQAAEKKDYSSAISQLKLAEKLSFGNRAPSKELAKIYETSGDLELAIKTLQGLPFDNYYQELGRVALKFQSYEIANSTFEKATSQLPSDVVYAGLALAQFNLGKTDEGCKNAEAASKENLNSTPAQEASAACLLLKNRVEEAAATYRQIITDFSDSPRFRDYSLIKLGVLKIGEDGLDKLNNKSVQDWLILAQIAALRGDLKLAIERAKSGYEIQPTNIELNKLLVDLYLKVKNETQVNIYRTNLINMGII